MYVKTFADLMDGQPTVEIVSLLKGNVVRKLTVKGDMVEIDPNDPAKPAVHPIVTVPLTTPIMYEPWVMDRGSLLFVHPDFKPHAKICTEGDILRLPNGDQAYIYPAPDAQQVK